MKLVARTAYPFYADGANHHGHSVDHGLPRLQALSAGEPGATQYTGIKALMLAVLEEAIRSYLGADARLRRDAAYWIACPGHGSPFAFATVCETLGLEAAAVRNALQRLRDNGASFGQEMRRSRPNVRKGRRLQAGRRRPRPTFLSAVTRASSRASK